MNKWLMVFVMLLAISADTVFANNDPSEDDTPGRTRTRTSNATNAPQPPIAGKPAPPKKKSKQISLNQASIKQLAQLPGGNTVEAARIIAGRPYNTKAKLVSENIIGTARYGEIKHLIVAGQLPTKAASAPQSQTKAK